jgi:hypothetical protein
MTVADKIRVRRAAAGFGITLPALADRLGARAAQELFNRIDRSLRKGTVVVGTSVREARSGFSKAHTAGCAQVVISRHGSSAHGQIDPSDGLVIIKIEDLEAVVKAAREEFDWARVFAPRSGLEAASSTPTLKRGSRGRRKLEA